MLSARMSCRRSRCAMHLTLAYVYYNFHMHIASPTNCSLNVVVNPVGTRPTPQRKKTCVQHAHASEYSTRTFLFSRSMPVHGAPRPVQWRSQPVREPCTPRANAIKATISRVRLIVSRIVPCGCETYFQLDSCPIVALGAGRVGSKSGTMILG